jgi:hypothetical protein
MTKGRLRSWQVQIATIPPANEVMAENLANGFL